MSQLFTTLSSYLQKIARSFPLIFARFVWGIFLGGAIMVLVSGSLFFYTNAYLVVSNAQEEVFVSIKKIDTSSYEAALDYIALQQTQGDRISSADPFAP